MAVFMRRRAGGSSIHRVEYIQSSRKQYFKTGFFPNQDSRVVMDVQALSEDTNPFFGSRVGDHTSNSFIFWCMGKTSVRSDYSTNHAFMSITNTQVRVIIDKNMNVTQFGSVSTTQDYEIFSIPYEMTLLAVNESDGVDPRLLSARLYACKIYDNGTLVRDYIPCKDPDGVVCLYDRVAQEYVYNAGGGTFTAGADI